MHLDEYGDKPAFIMIISDTTETKAAEELLTESERFYHATLDALTAHICVLDENGTIIAVNKAWEEFAVANSPLPIRSLGQSYFTVCEAAYGLSSEEAKPFAAGIHSVMSGDLSTCSQEYPCHTPSQKRWFAVVK